MVSYIHLKPQNNETYKINPTLIKIKKSPTNFRSYLWFPKGGCAEPPPQWKLHALTQKELGPRKSTWSSAHLPQSQDVNG